MSEEAREQDLYRQLGHIEGKLDAISAELKRVSLLVNTNKDSQIEHEDRLIHRVSKLEKDQVRQNTITVTLAGMVSFIVMIVSALINWGSKLFK